jgi:hypothetical protein
MSDYESILASLERQFPGRFLIGVRELAAIFEVSEKTVYNMTGRKSEKKFPVMPARVPGKKFRIVDVARALAERG